MPRHRISGAFSRLCESIRADRRKIITVVAVLGVFILMASVIQSGVGEETAKDETAVAEQRLGNTIDKYKQLAADVRGACDAKVLFGNICDQATSATQEPVPAEPGANGRDGEDGRNGADGRSPPCLAEPNQCRGSDGKDGASGKDGLPGTNGTNGVSPPCLSEPRQCRGLDGEDGSPAQSQTFVAPGGEVYECVRSGGSDVSPDYECTASSTEPPEDTP